ncbi:prephenate dehydratase domain-containing protein [Legionella wadsworthii]|nr:prephenate dehydratase domain-containing protein [Legionella wadsworthii]
MTISFGISGDAGSFSEEAALIYVHKKGIKSSMIHLLDMEGVLDALEQGIIELGIIPVVNLIGGLVTPAFQAMGRHLFTPIDELWHEINQCLLVKPGIQFHQIKHIVSHPQGLAQCRQFLEKKFKEAKKIEWVDTAKAAKDLAHHVLPAHSAVIAPARCAELYGLEILAKNIQDRQPNRTAFIIATKPKDNEWLLK